jgi:hypothetical protein
LGLKEKLPLINSNSKITRISGYIIYAALVLFVVGAILPSSPNVAVAGNSKSVEIRGYNFTLADAGDWLTHPKIDTARGYRWGPSSLEGYGPAAEQLIKSYWIGWHGQVMENAFYLPDKDCRGEPHCFYDDSENCYNRPDYCINDPDAIVAIYVLDKINPSELTEDSALKEASYLSNGYILAHILKSDASEKDITFDERPAHLIEWSGMAAMSVNLSPEKVAVIDVDYYDGNPWDVLQKISISG